MPLKEEGGEEREKEEREKEERREEEREEEEDEEEEEIVHFLRGQVHFDWKFLRCERHNLLNMKTMQGSNYKLNDDNLLDMATTQGSNFKLK